MAIKISKPAVVFLKEELDIKRGESVRFFVRLGGCGAVQDGFSLGMEKSVPSEIGCSVNIEGITFYLEKKDVWFLGQKELHIKHSRKKNEIEFHFKNT